MAISCRKNNSGKWYGEKMKEKKTFLASVESHDFHFSHDRKYFLTKETLFLTQ